MADFITTLHPENDANINLYPNIKKDNIPNGSVDQTKLSGGVNNILNGINTQLANAIASIEQPKYYSTLPTTDVGLIVYSDGYIYSWNGTQYVTTGIVYQSTQIDYQEYHNLINYNECFKGYYNTNGTLITNQGVVSYLISVSGGETLYFNLNHPTALVAYLNSSKELISTASVTTKSFTVPSGLNISYVAIPIALSKVKEYFVSDVNVPVNTNVNNSSVIFGAFTGRFDIDKLFDNIKNVNENDTDYNMGYVKNINSVGLKLLNNYISVNKWKAIKFNSNYLRCIILDGFILLGYNNSYLIALGMSDGKLFLLNRNNSSYTLLHDFGLLSDYNCKLLNYYIDNFDNVIVTKDDTNILSFNLNDYLQLEGYVLTFGWVFSTNNSAYLRNFDYIEIFDINANTSIYKYLSTDNIWSGKIWHSFGTSISDVATYGKYPTYLAGLSGLTLVNKAVAGGTISNQILNAIYNDTDIADADLITIEGFCNDWFYETPLGNLTDTTENTFYGYLYRAITYILANSDATLVVVTDYTGRNYGSHNSNRESVINGLTQNDFREATIKMCKYMNIPCIDAGSKSMISQDTASLYLVDQIHNTEKGGQQFANTIWCELKNIKPRII